MSEIDLTILINKLINEGLKGRKNSEVVLEEEKIPDADRASAKHIAFANIFIAFKDKTFDVHGSDTDIENLLKASKLDNKLIRKGNLVISQNKKWGPTVNIGGKIIANTFTFTITHLIWIYIVYFRRVSNESVVLLDLMSQVLLNDWGIDVVDFLEILLGFRDGQLERDIQIRRELTKNGLNGEQAIDYDKLQDYIFDVYKSYGTMFVPTDVGIEHITNLAELGALFLKHKHNLLHGPLNSLRNLTVRSLVLMSVLCFELEIGDGSSIVEAADKVTELVSMLISTDTNVERNPVFIINNH